MVSITLHIHKSLEENAGIYFEKAKQLRRKIQGAVVALERTRKQLDKVKSQDVEETKKHRKDTRKKEWYEKFRWFFTSEGFLVILGRDATSNEIIIKKHTDAQDLVFHTDMAGSPFAVIKSGGMEIGKASIGEAAQATASYSRAWKLGLNTLDVFYVKPEQLSKEAKPGEYLQKGAFMVYGKATYLHPALKLAVGLNDRGIVIGGPENAVKKHSKEYVVLVQGNDLPSMIAKKLHQKFHADVDEILRFLPSGGCKIGQ